MEKMYSFLLFIISYKKYFTLNLVINVNLMVVHYKLNERSRDKI